MSASRTTQAASGSDSEDEVDFINVEFDFQAPNEIDFQALKRLFQQLFYTHAPQLDLGVLADHVIEQAQSRGVGTVVKVDDLEQVHDPYAVMSALLLGPPSPAQALVHSYLATQLRRSASAQSLLALLEQASAEKPLLFVVHERMINLPPQITPPLIQMLLEECQELQEETSAPTPTHALFFSRAFSADALDEGDDEDEEPTGLAGARKRKARGAHAHPDDAAAAALGKSVSNKKRTGTGLDDGLGSFHPEDELIRPFATHAHTFRFPAPRDAPDTYEAPIFGRLMAVPYTHLPAILEKMQSVWPAPA
ncbi:Mss4 nuclear export [Malassezia pachydermatis]|uniref:Protein BCP1 n=1 Tax=Malassezia pachydermatis TaxID=77020 RepID=A0A0M9VQ75_9BASI|nr:hypothetical protein Malapachy_2247 [Malassezia pachydermatis]KOS15219.1 hypothetical protein Malapachy_2247 [Malassezia pachydermatis]